MKKIYTLSMIVLLIAVCTQQRLHAQTKQSGLNQMELLKQFIGTWRNDANKDTVYTAEFKPYGNGGLDFKLTSITKGKAWFEMKELWGYDKKNDKVVVAGLVKDSPKIMLSALWFTSNNKCEQVPLEFVSNPDQSGFKVIFEIKSPDIVTRNEIMNNKSAGIETYTRVKN